MKKLFFILFSLFTTIGFAQAQRGSFVYQFHDSSVPPRYHRSYMISIEDTVVHFVVDSYGDVLLDEVYSISEDQLQDLKKKAQGL